MTKVKGFSLLSLLAILTIASAVPATLGSKVMTNVWVPPFAANVPEAGWVVTLKALLPLRATLGVLVRLSAAVPLLVMVKVRATVPPATLVLPKSVWSVVLGEASPLVMSVPFPLTAISGDVGLKPTKTWAAPLSEPELSDGLYVEPLSSP